MKDMRFQDTTFENDRIHIDGNTYESCVFNNCSLIYSGGVLPSFVDCSLNDGGFAFSDQAARTISLLQHMYHGGFKEIVDATWESIIAVKPDSGQTNGK